MIKQFRSLFSGLQEVYGQFSLIKKTDHKKKVEGHATTITKQITKKVYEDHLIGKQGLGIVPIRKDNTCLFGCIDIDDYSLDLNILERKIQKTPLVLCRTKSGGAHLFLFNQKPLPAIDVRKKLEEFAISLGHKESEIFPKQDKLEEGDQGSWINLPYFNHERTVRYCIKEGKALNLEEFLQYAELKKIKDLSEIKISDELIDGPPCLQYLIFSGVKEGRRDSVLFNLAIYCKLKNKENWETLIYEFNEKYIVPPLKQNLIANQIIKGLLKKDYFYMCKNSPLKQYCNKEICITRKFGIKSSIDLLIGGLIKIDTIPPIWYLEIEGQRVEFSTVELTNQVQFRRVCFETIHKIPRRVPDLKWDKLMQEKLNNLEIIKAPEDAGTWGQFYYLLKVFCTERAIARDKAELLQHKPWTDQGRIYFQSHSLLDFLDNKKFKSTPSKVFDLVRGIGGSTSRFRVKGKTIRVWSIPVYKDQQNEEFDSPIIEEEAF